MTVWIAEVHRDRAAAPFDGGRPVQADKRLTVGVPERSQCFEQPAGETPHATLDRLHANRLEMSQSNLNSRDAQIVEGAVLEPGFARG